jgi:hypothetical protein
MDIRELINVIVGVALLAPGPIYLRDLTTTQIIVVVFIIHAIRFFIIRLLLPGPGH